MNCNDMNEHNIHQQSCTAHDVYWLIFQRATGLSKMGKPKWNDVYGYWVCTCVPQLNCHIDADYNNFIQGTSN